MAKLLEAQKVGVQFGGINAVQNVSFSVTAGEIFGLLGPNGAGKTTLFNLISGTVRPMIASLCQNSNIELVALLGQNSNIELFASLCQNSNIELVASLWQSLFFSGKYTEIYFLAVKSVKKV